MLDTNHDHTDRSGRAYDWKIALRRIRLPGPILSVVPDDKRADDLQDPRGYPKAGYSSLSLHRRAKSAAS